MYIGTRSTEEVSPYPGGRLPGLDETLSPHGRTSARVLLRPCQHPRAMLGRMLGLVPIRVVVLGQAPSQVVGAPDVEATRSVLQDIRPAWAGFGSQTPRTQPFTNSARSALSKSVNQRGDGSKPGPLAYAFTSRLHSGRDSEPSPGRSDRPGNRRAKRAHLGGMIGA